MRREKIRGLFELEVGFQPTSAGAESTDVIQANDSDVKGVLAPQWTSLIWHPLGFQLLRISSLPPDISCPYPAASLAIKEWTK